MMVECSYCLVRNDHKTMMSHGFTRWGCNDVDTCVYRLDIYLRHQGDTDGFLWRFEDDY